MLKKKYSELFLEYFSWLSGHYEQILMEIVKNWE